MLNKLIPDLFVPTIYKIDFNDLQRQGKKGIIVDLDNTLVEATRPDATPELVSWLDQLRGMGFRVIIVSNNNRTRVAHFATPLRVPHIHNAKKPFTSSFQQAMQRLKTVPEETVMIGDQLLTDVLGGNRLGLYTILVTPISETEGFFSRINRRIERIVVKKLERKGQWKKGDQDE